MKLEFGRLYKGPAYVRKWFSFICAILPAWECHDSKKSLCERLLNFLLSLFCAFCLCIFIALMKATGAVENLVEIF